MPRQIEKLTAPRLAKATARGLHGDGAGLYVQVSANGARSWLYRFSIGGRRRAMGLGSLRVVDLRIARERARQCSRLVYEGIDPIERRRHERAQQRGRQAARLTFDKAADAYFESQKTGWKSKKHRDQWLSTVRTYISPAIGKTPVQEIGTTAVLRILQPIWSSKVETAVRVRNRIEVVLAWAKAHGHRSGDNPARWTGHLDKILPAKSKLQQTTHFAALPYPEIASVMASIKQVSSPAAEALQLLILTATRTNETLGARWDEIDLENGVWSIPGSRMKSGRDHRIPLSEPALTILRERKPLATSQLVFAGRGKVRGREGQLAEVSFRKVLSQIQRVDITTHGFRSTFRDWAAEETDTPNEVVEMALAHSIKSQVEAAYRRGDLLQKRLALMEAWARYCRGETTAAGTSPTPKMETNN